MARFGDNSTTFMRSGTLDGGMRMEAGCWTQCVAAATNIPTNLTRVISLVCGSEGATTTPTVTNGTIVATTADDKTDKILNYIAVGW